METSLGIKILDNCCSPAYLDCLKRIAINSENWNLLFPAGIDFSSGQRFPKLTIIDNGVIKHPILAGLSIGLLFQIHEAAGRVTRDLFIPEIFWCGLSIKDKHKPDIKHSDYEKDKNFVKILGILNSDWKEEWGGGFFHNGTSNYIKPTSFCIFDPTKPHAAEAIFTDQPRIAIDFTVFPNQESLKNMKEINKRKGH